MVTYFHTDSLKQLAGEKNRAEIETNNANSTICGENYFYMLGNFWK